MTSRKIIIDDPGVDDGADNVGVDLAAHAIRYLREQLAAAESTAHG